jgi:hypothetical protein
MVYLILVPLDSCIFSTVLLGKSDHGDKIQRITPGNRLFSLLLQGVVVNILQKGPARG